MTDYEYIPQGPRERRSATPTRKRKGDLPPRTKMPDRPEKSEFRRQMERVFNGDYSGTSLGRSIGAAVARCNARQRGIARKMLFQFESQGALVASAPDTIRGVVQLARFSDSFVRTPNRFLVTGDTPVEQLRRLANHLLELWAVPACLDDAWLRDDLRVQTWFVHLGSGESFRTAPDLPFSLTKRMAHFAANAPRGLTPVQSLRWGQCRGMDMPEELCQEVVNTRLSAELPDEPFWKTVLLWFSVNPEILGHASTIVDYAFAQRIGDFAPAQARNWSITGRDPDRLLTDARAWHRELNRRRNQFRNFPPVWRTCGIAGLIPKPDGDSTAPKRAEPPSWAIIELLTADQLDIEGKRLHHCVSSYAPLAASGRCAIYSLRRNTSGIETSAATIEIRPQQRLIVQARTTQNAEPAEADKRLIEHWAQKSGLAISPGVFSTARRAPR